MKILLFSCLLFGVISIAFAQKKKSMYFIVPQVALLNGDQSVSSQLSLIGGWEKNKWGFGLGAAIDYYKVRTAPIFLSTHYYLNKTKQFSAYASLGTNIAWPLENQFANNFNRVGWSSIQHKGFKNGMYTDWGIRYLFLNSKLNGLTIALGYSTKSVTENFDETIYNPMIIGPASITIVPRTLDYKFNRIAITIGYRL